jgi:hypothetical protein
MDGEELTGGGSLSIVHTGFGYTGGFKKVLWKNVLQSS